MHTLSRLMSAATAITMTFAAAPAFAQQVTPPKPSQLIVFGDSLVDAGNINAAVGSDIFNPVARGYFPGRFTNGPDYTDLLNQRLFGRLLTPSLLGGTNYAFGGARIVNDGDPVPDLALQLRTYFATTSNQVDPNALYIINAGGNDVFGIERGQIGGFANPTAYTMSLLDSLAGSIQALSIRGASRILVTGIPNLTATGFALEGLVQARFDLIEPTLGNTQLLRFSYLNFFQELSANPARFGLPPFDQTGTCISQRVPVNGVINCSGFFSFDGVHPTAAVQAALFGEVANLTGISIPEPESWAMMIIGFGFIGAKLRGSRRRVKIRYS
jgi:phospholipase/lecithinase/hemolysin